MKKYLKTSIIISFLFILLMPGVTYADFGPKPSLHIYIQGNSERQYYVNIMDKDYNIEDYDSSKMYIYKEGEWKVALYKNESVKFFL